MAEQVEQVSKQDLLGKMDDAYKSLVALVLSVPIEQAGSLKVYDELTTKDVLAHVTGWLNLEAEHIEDTLNGKPFQRASVAYGVYSEGASSDELMDKINERIFEQNKDRSPKALLDDFSKAHARLVSAVERLSDEELNDPQRFDWLGGDSIVGSIAGNSYEHYQEHEALIKQGLQAANTEQTLAEPKSIGKDELLIKMSDGYSKLLAVINSVDETQATEQSVYGELAIKDVLGHLAAWADMEAGWLEATLRGEPVVRFAPGYTIQAGGSNNEEVMNRLNEHIFQQHKADSLGTIKEAFQAAHSRLQSIVEQMSESDLNNPVGFNWWPGEPIWHSIAANSCGHYAEHEALIRERFPQRF